MIAININVTKIDKTGLYDGKNGKYLALTLHENKNGEDQYGNTGFVTQDLGKERRQKGERGEILGNYKVIGSTQPQPRTSPGMPPAPAQTEDDGDDEIPF